MLVGGSVGRKGGRAQAKGEMEERVEGAVEDLDVLTGTVGKIRTKKNYSPSGGLGQFLDTTNVLCIHTKAPNMHGGFSDNFELV